MGRIVSCKKCGRWVELEAGQSPRDFICDECGGSGPSSDPAAEAPPSASPRAAGSRSPSIGPDSGTIGSSVGDVAPVTDLSEQLAQIHVNPDDLKVETSGLEEASRRLADLSRRGLQTESPELAELQSRGVEALDFAREKAAQGLGRAKDLAEDFAREQAVTAAEAARDLVEEKGLGAVTELDDFAKQQGRRIGSEAIKRVEDELKSTARQAAEAVREAADRQRHQKKRRVVHRSREPRQQSICKLCQEAIVSGDRVTACPKCGSQYHNQCYSMLGGCASAECKAAALRPAPGGAAPGPPAAETPITPAPPGEKRAAVRRCEACGTQVSRGTLVCSQCGRWLYSGRTKSDPRSRKGQGAGPLGCTSSVLLLAIGIGALLVWLVAT
ncbi:MAG: hypothetical protein GWP05_06000 [Anaerolineaceae bacterium]|nr:hypothetical protein [Anaerolineaceae bacterium]